MHRTFGLCAVCFQSTYGTCCDACEGLLRCLSEPDANLKTVQSEEEATPSRSVESLPSCDTSSASSASSDAGSMEVDEPITILAQEPYSNGASLTAAPIPSIAFGRRVSVEAAAREDVRCVQDADEPAFSADVSIRQKMSVRLMIEGHQPYEHQTNVRRSKNKRPTRGELAVILAKEIERFMDRERQIGNPLRHEDEEVTPSQVLLLGVEHVSRSSLQPVVGVSHVSVRL